MSVLAGTTFAGEYCVLVADRCASTSCTAASMAAFGVPGRTGQLTWGSAAFLLATVACSFLHCSVMGVVGTMQHEVEGRCALGKRGRSVCIHAGGRCSLAQGWLSLAQCSHHLLATFVGNHKFHCINEPLVLAHSVSQYIHQRHTVFQ
eukprot:scaffold94972_cov22-Tisochrysis_lutea.AAC.1